MSRPMTLPCLRDVIRVAVTQLADAGVSSPRHDAERLAAYASGELWSDLWSVMDEPFEGPVGERFRGLIARRSAGEPLAYITGSTVFYGLTIACGPGALVPRPETETLVDAALELIDGTPEPVVVDIGCGTGAIALAIAMQRRDARVIATDISEDALAYARANARGLGCDVSFSTGDLFDAVPSDLRGGVDLIVSNPPYVPAGTALPADVLAEPAVALFAGPDGDETLTRIVRAAPDWLARNGAIALEIGEERQSAVLAGGRVRDDLTGRPRVVWARY
jgi:release factor glutamine methyltransferase